MCFQVLPHLLSQLGLLALNLVALQQASMQALPHHHTLHALLLAQCLLRGACPGYRNSWCSGGVFKASKYSCTKVAGLHRSTGRNVTASHVLPSEQATLMWEKAFAKKHVLTESDALLGA